MAVEQPSPAQSYVEAPSGRTQRTKAGAVPRFWDDSEMSAGIATIGRPGAAGCCHSQKWPRATAAPCWQSHLGPRARWGAPPVVVEGGFGLGVRWKGCRRGGREIKARSGTTAPAIIKELSVGHGLISCLQARRGGRWARLLQPAAHRSFLPLYQPPSPAIPTRYGHRAAPVAAAAERRLAAGCQSTGNLQPLQQRSRKEALLAVCCVQQLASTCATARSYKQTRPPAKRLRGCAQQRRKNLVASC